jgi:hypothetical protein
VQGCTGPENPGRVRRPGFSVSTMRFMALPVDIAARAHRARPGLALKTTFAVPGVAIGWLIGRTLLVLGWVAGAIWLMLAFCAEAIGYGFRVGAKLPTEPVEAEEKSEPPKQQRSSSPPR